MTFGSANDAAGVTAYLGSVHGGRKPSLELVAEFERRYRLIGRSPLHDITSAQGQALQVELDRAFGADRFLVGIGMLHAEPRLAVTVEAFVAQGVQQIVAITLAPQFSPLILGGYQRTLDQLASGYAVEIRLAGAWHQDPDFIASLADRVRVTLDTLAPLDRQTVPVLFTAHSLPLAVVERDPGYITQLTDTAEAVACEVELPRSRWHFAYQSAGHSPEPWLKPDLVDLLPGLRSAGHQDVVIAPLQFCADHLEILYDLDIAAREQAEAQGLRYHRIAMPNTSPRFIRALGNVVRRELTPIDNALMSA